MPLHAGRRHGRSFQNFAHEQNLSCQDFAHEQKVLALVARRRTAFPVNAIPSLKAEPCVGGANPGCFKLKSDVSGDISVSVEYKRERRAGDPEPISNLIYA